MRRDGHSDSFLPKVPADIWKEGGDQVFLPSDFTSVIGCRGSNQSMEAEFGAHQVFFVPETS